jgi:hypothetical protein
MSYHGRAVLAAIDLAGAIRERHPTLFAAQLRADRTCLQLARAMDRYRRRQPPGREEAYMGDREAERVDTSWEEAETARRQRHWDARKPDIDRARRDARHRLEFDEFGRPRPAHSASADLFRLALERAATISTVAAGNPEPSSGGGSDSAAPPRQQTLEEDPRWNRRWQIVKRGLLLIHDLLDEAEGLATRPWTDATSEEMNRVVLTEGRGLSCKEVAAQFPEATAGRASVVARLRRNQGSGIPGLDVLGYRVSVIDGEPVMDTEAASVRRVVIEAD